MNNSNRRRTKNVPRERGRERGAANIPHGKKLPDRKTIQPKPKPKPKKK